MNTCRGAFLCLPIADIKSTIHVSATNGFVLPQDPSTPRQRHPNVAKDRPPLLWPHASSPRRNASNTAREKYGRMNNWVSSNGCCVKGCARLLTSPARQPAHPLAHPPEYLACYNCTVRPGFLWLECLSNLYCVRHQSQGGCLSNGHAKLIATELLRKACRALRQLHTLGPIRQSESHILNPLESVPSNSASPTSILFATFVMARLVQWQHLCRQPTLN